MNTKTSLLSVKARRVRSRSGKALLLNSEGRFVVDLLNKTVVSAESNKRIETISEMSVKARNASFLDRYRAKSA